MSHLVVRGDARRIPLADGSVSLIVSSPPYWSQRSYRDAGEHFDAQMGSETHAQFWLEAMWGVMRECWRVLDDGGSCFINLGDKRTGSGGPGGDYNPGGLRDGQPRAKRANGRPSTWTEQDAAWLAGVIDCDGSISVHVNKGRVTSYYVGWARVGQMRPEVVQRCAKVTGVGQVFQDARGVWNWNVAAQQARYVLERIWPWLRIKQRQALGVIELGRHIEEQDGIAGRAVPRSLASLKYRQVIRDAVVGWNRGEESDWRPPHSPIIRLPLHSEFGRRKSRQLLPERFAIGCEDGLADPEGIGWIVRQVIVWQKANCLSGGTQVYARVKGRPTSIKVHDLCRAYAPEDVEFWNGQRWTQVLWWQPTGRNPDAAESYKAIRAARRRAEEPIVAGDIEVELRSGERIGCTRDHRWPTRRGLVAASALRPGDVIKTAPLPEGGTYPAGLDDELTGWFVGLYIAEGSRSEQTIQIAGHVKEVERFKRLCELAAAYHGTCVAHPTRGNGATINLTGRMLQAILDTYVGGRTAKDKHLAPKAWQRSNIFLRAVLEGYLSGDGHYEAKANRWAIGFTSNDYWASDLHTLGARLNVSVRLRRATVTGFGKEWPSWQGSLVMDPLRRRQPDSQVVAIRQSRARQFWDIGVADDPHLFALASGVLTHNSLPESVTDRTRDDFEYIYHLTKSERYFAAIDEIREPHQTTGGMTVDERRKAYPEMTQRNVQNGSRPGATPKFAGSSLGRVPGSVWRIASEPLRIPDWGKEKYNLPDHFASFPTEIPRRLILGFSPSGICTACNEPRRPVVEKEGRSTYAKLGKTGRDASAKVRGDTPDVGGGNVRTENGTVPHFESRATTIIGCACRCPDTSAPTRNAVVLDVFGGTGTTALVAETLGRTGISLDLSADYCNLARWRIEESGHGAKAEQRTWQESQGTLL